MTFPLFKLPFLALRNAVFQMDGGEIVDLSFCSKASQRLVSNLARKQFHAVVRASEHRGSITMFDRNSECEAVYPIFIPEHLTPEIIAAETTHTRTINGVTVPFLSSYMSIWETLRVGCLFFAGYFITLFGIEAIEKMQFRIKTEADLILLVDWLQKWKPTIKSFEVIGEDDSVRVQSKLVESLLQNLNVTDNLRVFIPSRRCTITRKLTLKHIYLASTCTFDSLLNFDSENITIGGITSLDLNKFLLNWKNGGFQKLKTLGAKFKLDWAVLTNGITRKRFRNARTITYFSMENINGVKASIKIISADHAMNCYWETIEFVIRQQQPDLIEL